MKFLDESGNPLPIPDWGIQAEIYKEQMDKQQKKAMIELIRMDELDALIEQGLASRDDKKCIIEIADVNTDKEWLDDIQEIYPNYTIQLGMIR